MSIDKKSIPVYVMLAAVCCLLSGTAAYAQSQDQDQNEQSQSQSTTITTTTSGPVVTTHHFWNPEHWLWRHGLQNPYGVFQSNNVVVIPAQTLAQSVVNTCPSYAPVLLSTGQCLTVQQAIYEIQTGQLQVGGQVQAAGSVVVGVPTTLAVTGFSDPFAFFHAHHAFEHMIHEAQEANETH